MSTIVIEVDLENHHCNKKIRKAISKLHSRFHIQSTVYDVKANTVTISGPFDAEKARTKLCYNAGSIIKDIQIKGTEEEEEPPEDSEPAEPKAEEAEDSEPDEPNDNKAEDAEPVAEPAYNGYYAYDWPPLGPPGQGAAVDGQPFYGEKFRYHSMFSDEDPQASCGIM